jgi:hypothetical protein
MRGENPGVTGMKRMSSSGNIGGGGKVTHSAELDAMYNDMYERM